MVLFHFVDVVCVDALCQDCVKSYIVIMVVNKRENLCKRPKRDVFACVHVFCVDLQLTKIGNIVYNIQDTADRKTLSEAKQSKQAFNRILCVIENCLHSLFTSSVVTAAIIVIVVVVIQTTILIEINSKTFFWFICFSFVCWLQTLRFDFWTESRFHEEYETKESERKHE